jgi:hypothetical protein
MLKFRPGAGCPILRVLCEGWDPQNLEVRLYSSRHSVGEQPPAPLSSRLPRLPRLPRLAVGLAVGRAVGPNPDFLPRGATNDHVCGFH